MSGKDEEVDPHEAALEADEEPSGARPMGNNTLMYRKDELDTNREIRQAEIQSENTKGLYDLVGKIVMGGVIIIIIVIAGYWATQDVGTTIKHGETEINVTGGAKD